MNLPNRSMMPGSIRPRCPTCKGKGIIETNIKGQSRVCPHCNGKGSGFATK